MRDSARLFYEIYGTSPTLRGFAPGRVNLIGEHTDYNGGCVFPCALHLGIEGAARARTDRVLRFFSESFPDGGVREYSLDCLEPDGSWTDYPKSVLRTFAAMGYLPPHGADFAFTGDLPDGAGLSSSAALEVLTGLLLRGLYGFSVTAQELAVFGQFAENRFIGVNCGIMDQFASAMGRAGHAMLLDSNTLAYRYAPVPPEASLVIINSGVKHSLASSAYNDRRRSCETALAQLSTAIRVSALCALTPEEFEAHCRLITDPVCRRRARHAVYEHRRTLNAADALSRGDLNAFGALMKESHRSLRDDYEVSCAELDFLAETAWQCEGVFGARMTGGGFGGCTVNLVRQECTDRFITAVQTAYRQQFGKEAAAYVARIGDGAHSLPIQTDKR